MSDLDHGTLCPVCEDEFWGSHWHCANCGKISSMLGHYINSKDGFSCEPKERT